MLFLCHYYVYFLDFFINILSNDQYIVNVLNHILLIKKKKKNNTFMVCQSKHNLQIYKWNNNYSILHKCVNIVVKN